MLRPSGMQHPELERTRASLKRSIVAAVIGTAAGMVLVLASLWRATQPEGTPAEAFLVAIGAVLVLSNALLLRGYVTEYQHSGSSDLGGSSLSRPHEPNSERR